jgi:hypothetical protein
VDNGDTVAHEHQVGEGNPPGPGRRRRDLRKELRGPDGLEAIMADVVITMAVALFSGILVGVIAVIAIAIRREDRRYTLAVAAPDRLTRNARRLTGVARRDLDTNFLHPVDQLVR